MEQIQELAEELASLAECCMHDPQWQASDVERVIAWGNESPEGYSSPDQVILVKLKDGYGLLVSSSDTTGHGCVCSSETTRSDSLSGLLCHLTDWELEGLLRDRKR